MVRHKIGDTTNSKVGQGAMTSLISTDDSYRIKPPSSADGAMPPAYDVGGGRSVPEAAIEQFERDGAICLRNVIDEKTIDLLRAEADDAIANPSEDARFVCTPGNDAIFYYEFNLWRRHAELKKVLHESPIADLGAALMRSSGVALHYTNTFVKDAGASDKPTPWHEDASYHRMMGRNALAMFLAYDHMPAETTLKYKQASHLKEDPIYMASTFLKGEEYGEWMEDHVPMPPQAELDERFRTVYWEVDPGDVLVFTQRTLHAGPPNTLPTRRHATSFNLIGDGIRYDGRPGPVDSPGGLDPKLEHGAVPVSDAYPILRGKLS
jgi:ectoine hydroxylase-related dioxygenase (phytanoyl-CoA dioxygenase family)